MAGIMRMLFKPQQTIQRIWRKCPVGPFSRRMAYDISQRPHFTYGIYHAAQTAQRLGVPKITAIEFGVAGGNGLLAMEQIGSEVERETGVGIAVCGFDTGSGLPQPVDYRDEPYIYGHGQYTMDQDALRRRLKRSRLVLGDVKETVPEFSKEKLNAPIGFVSFDLDFYSSTVNALKLFETNHENILPRVFCYFDDIIGDDLELHNDWTGELLAIKEFNANHEVRKIAPINGLRHKRAIPARWNDMMYVLHDFEHPHYGEFVSSAESAQRPLS